MAQQVIIKLTDDMHGGDADETVVFSLDGKTYEIDLTAENASALRFDFGKYISRARPANPNRISTQAGTVARPPRIESAPTLFSQLDSEEKDRFRKWADLPTARRIADTRVQAWIDAGRP